MFDSFTLYPDKSSLGYKAFKSVEFNKKWSQKWEVIDTQKEPMPGYEKHSGEANKLEKYFKDK